MRGGSRQPSGGSREMKGACSLQGVRESAIRMGHAASSEWTRREGHNRSLKEKTEQKAEHLQGARVGERPRCRSVGLRAPVRVPDRLSRVQLRCRLLGACACVLSRMWTLRGSFDEASFGVHACSRNNCVGGSFSAVLDTKGAKPQPVHGRYLMWGGEERQEEPGFESSMLATSNIGIAPCRPQRIWAP